ncbi:MAG: RNA polymerase sigma factor [Terracidiphilus sp.]
MPEQNDNRALYEWLALRCQSGERGAFEDLIAFMERPLLYYATSLTGSQDAALDVLQDVWLKVFRGIRKLKDPGALRPWLYTITHGIAVDRIRRNYSQRQAEEEQLRDFQEAEEPTFANEDAAAIHIALEQITLKHREVLVLHFLEDLTLAGIAQVVGCSEGTVKSRLHYAKRALKEILKGERNGQEN